MEFIDVVQVERCLVSGRLRHMVDGKRYGAVSLKRTAKGWLQLGDETSKHLSREYVCNESFETVLHTWLPCDFRELAVEVLETSEVVVPPPEMEAGNEDDYVEAQDEWEEEY